MRARLLLILMLLVPSAAWAASPAELMDQAHKQFQDAAALSATDPDKAFSGYRQAAMSYQALLEQVGNNGKIHYNLGNCYFRMNDMGRAILHYRRAKALSPNDGQLLTNLQAARSRRPDQFEETQGSQVLKTVLFLHYDLPLSLRRTLFAVTFVLFWLLACAALYRRPAWLKGGLWLLGVLALTFMASVWVSERALETRRPGVILAEEVEARKGDGVTYQPAFAEPLHAGTEFELLEERPGWWRIELPDGRSCWVEDKTSELLF